MKSIIKCFLSCSTSAALLATFSSVIALPSSAAFPADSQELRLSRDSDIGELKKLLNQGDLVKFYQTAHTHMEQLEWRDIRGGVSPDKLDRLLLIARITSAAPLFGENENTPFEQMTPDFDLKNDISLKGKVMVDLVIISKIKSFLKDGGGGLLRILLDNYPGKATEVFKYLKLAGYEEGEMMELVDREEGKTEETEFLYQSPLGRKFLKEKKQKK